MKTWICILNWNGGADTVKTVQSVLHEDSAVICVLDNGSTDDSLTVIETFLRDEHISYRRMSSGQLSRDAAQNTRVLLLENEKNLGFAGGNNILLRAALQDNEARYAWLLNNDALAEEHTLKELISSCESSPDIAFAGSVVLDGQDASRIQCRSVRYFPRIGISKLRAKNEVADRTCTGTETAGPSDFQHGASLLVRLDAAKQFGLLDERFFLYFEEQDWQFRARKQGWANVLSSGSFVKHLGSMSTASNRHLFFYYYNRSAAIFARLHNSPLQRACNRLALPMILLLRTRGNVKSLRSGLQGLREGWNISL